LVVLRSSNASSVANAALEAELQEREWVDIARYLDVTRSEMVFARKVLLVEGLAEQLLAPPMARSIGVDLDAQGISVCAIGGVNFEPYAKFLSALGIPFVVVTDGDPRGPRARTGESRMEQLASRLDGTASPAELGLFYGDQTLEVDIQDADESNRVALVKALLRFDWGDERKGELEDALDGNPLSAERLLQFADAVSKGRLAQRVAGENGEIIPPAYIRDGLEHLQDT
jgi:putative ATP-dependent endonuclease of OLD family